MEEGTNVFIQQIIVEELAMDEQDEKMKNIHTATHDDVDKTQDSISENIPLDLIFEILSRLPVKSILRFRCVSKLWSSFTKLSSFINLFSSRSSTRPPNLLITFSNRSVFSFPQYTNLNKCSLLYNYQMTYPDYFSNRLSEIVHGLILVENFTIWNPSLRRLFTIPHPDKNMRSSKYNCLLGYDPSEGKHKVLCLLDEEYSDSPQVITLGAQESWRKISKSSHMHFPVISGGRCFNGIIYYTARILGVKVFILMSFDVKYETLSPIKIPKDRYFMNLISFIIPYEGRVAILDIISSLDHVDLHILKDPYGNEWTKVRFLHLPYKREGMSPLRFHGITDADELVLSTFKFSGAGVISEPYYIIYFDPKKNRIREAKFEGIIYGNTVMMQFEIFPNHIESLMSL